MTDSDGAVSAAEERFEILRRTVGLFLGPIVFVLLLLFPISGLPEAAQTLAPVLALTIIWWMCEPVPLPVTAMLGPALCVMLGLGTAKEIFAPFADPIIFIFVGGFILAAAMMRHGLDRRLALTLLAVPAVSAGPRRVIVAFGVASAGLSMWISNTACTAMMLPIALGIAAEVADSNGSPAPRFTTALLLMTAYAASIGGIATPVGTPPNLIGIGYMNRLLGEDIGFLEWMTFALPSVIAMFAVLAVLLVLVIPPERGNLTGLSQYLRERRNALGPWTPGQRNTMIAFGTAVVLWITPGLLDLILGSDHAVAKRAKAMLGEGIVAILAASLLFVLPVNWKKREFTMTWKAATGIDWGTVLLFGGGLALGSLASSTGLAEGFGKVLMSATGITSFAGIVLIGIVLSIITSELTSNTAAATVMIPVVVALAEQAGVDPVGAALAACLGASFGFMLPVSTPPNAIVYGTGQVPITRMVKTGILFDIAGALVIWATVVMFFGGRAATQ